MVKYYQGLPIKSMLYTVAMSMYYSNSDDDLIFSMLFAKKPVLRLPPSLREQMRKPLGFVFPNEQETLDHIKKTNPKMVIGVGDVVTSSLQKIGYTPNIGILDFKTRRDNYFLKTPSGKTYVNTPGEINREAVVALKVLITESLELDKKNNLYIEGEEDLLALPAILFAPINSVVLYGQFNLGVVFTKVTKEKKDIVKAMLLQFD